MPGSGSRKTPSPAASLKKSLGYVFKVSYFRLHLAYFLILAAAGTILLRIIGGKSLPWIDCLYCITSALCLSGLSSVPVEQIPRLGQVVIMFGMILGGQIFTSVIPLLVKRHRYRKVVKSLVETAERAAAQEERNARPPVERASFSRSDPEAGPAEPVAKAAKKLVKSLSRSIKGRGKDDQYMEQMVLRHEERIEGGSLQSVLQEYRATVLLTRIVLGYYTVVQLLGFLVAVVSILASPHARRILRAKRVNAGFFALFATISAFANCGYILVNENMVALNTSNVLLLDIFALVLLGNTLYAPVLRFIILVQSKFNKESSKEAYQFLLDHPRKCYTHLFPQATTVWLVVAVAGFLGFQALMFFILDWNGKAMRGMSTDEKIVNGIFEASGTRTSGMNSVVLTDLTPAMLFLYCGMMYISAYPVFLSRQHSRVEEHEQARQQEPKGMDRDLYDTTITTQSRRLLARDWSFLFFIIFAICISENKKMQHDPINFSMFSVIFEVISAYGSVGLTLGYNCSSRIQPGPCQDVACSFSSTWDKISKIFLIIVMFMGRHRGLPDNIDSAVVLPERRFSRMVVLNAQGVTEAATTTQSTPAVPVQTAQPPAEASPSGEVQAEPAAMQAEAAGTS